MICAATSKPITITAVIPVYQRILTLPQFTTLSLTTFLTTHIRSMLTTFILPHVVIAGRTRKTVFRITSIFFVVSGVCAGAGRTTLGNLTGGGCTDFGLNEMLGYKITIIAETAGWVVTATILRGVAACAGFGGCSSDN